MRSRAMAAAAAVWCGSSKKTQADTRCRALTLEISTEKGGEPLRAMGQRRTQQLPFSASTLITWKWLSGFSSRRTN
jgi:hypothetical protein